MTEDAPSSPFQGLQPFPEARSDYFFGRALDVVLVADNARAHPLTVLFGPSGVGKTSLLHAGVIPRIRHENASRREAFGQVETVVAACSDWRDDPVRAMSEAIRAAFRDQLGVELDRGHDGADSYVDPRVVLGACQVHEVDLLLVLDQVDELFTYGSERVERVARYLRPLADRGARANVLLAIREDALALLDEMVPQLPDVFDNPLRLQHLDEAGAREAVAGPVERFNGAHRDLVPWVVEPDLIDELVRQVRIGRVRVEWAAGPAVEDAEEDVRVEAAFLQLVLLQLWDTELADGSSIMRASTLRALGGAEQIVRQHFDRVVAGFDAADLDALCDLSGYLVTPSGTKIAHTASDLAELAGRSLEDTRRLLLALSAGDRRVLRDLPAALDVPHAEPRYEIFHDILALAVRDWRGRHLADRRLAQEQRRLATEEQLHHETRRRLRRTRGAVAALALLLVGVLVLATVAVVNVRRAHLERDRADEATVVAQMNQSLATDPAKALELGVRAGHDYDGDAFTAAFRSAYAASTIDIRLELGSVVAAVLPVGDDGDFVTVTRDGWVRTWDVSLVDGALRVAKGAADAEPALAVDATPELNDGEVVRVFSASLMGEGRFVLLSGYAMEDLVVDLDTGDVSPLSTPGSDDQTYVTAARGSDVAFYDTNTGTSLRVEDIDSRVARELPGTRGWSFSAVEFDPSGRYLAAVMQRGRDMVVSLWDLADDSQVSVSPLPAPRYTGTYLPDLAVGGGPGVPLVGGALIGGARDDAMAQWLWQPGAPARSLGVTRLTGAPAYSIALTADGQLVSAAGRSVALRRDADESTMTETKPQPVSALSVDQDGRLLLVGSLDGQLDLYDSRDPSQPIQRFRGQTGSVVDVTFLSDHRSVVSSGEGGSVVVWRMPDSQSLWSNPSGRILDAAFSSSGSRIAVVGVADDYRAQLDDQGAVLNARACSGRTAEGCLAYNPTTRRTIEPSFEGDRAVMLETSTPVVEVWDEGREARLETRPEGSDDYLGVTAVAMGGQGEAEVIVGGTRENSVLMWRWPDPTPTLLGELGDASRAIIDVEVSEDGAWAAVLDEAAKLTLISVADGGPVGSWTSPGADSLDLSVDGAWVLAVDEGQRDVRVWEVAAALGHGRDVDDEGRRLTYPSSGLADAAFSRDDDASRVVAAASDGNVVMFDRGSERVIGVLPAHLAGVNVVAVDPTDPSSILSTGNDDDLVVTRCAMCDMDAAAFYRAATQRLPQVIDLRDLVAALS